MKENLNDQQKLVAFLKQNRPLPPPVKNNCEAELMTLIKQQPRFFGFCKNRLLWLITGAIAASYLLVISGLNKPNFSPKIANQEQDLEAFIINTWDASLGGGIGNNDLHKLENEWFLLTETDFISNQQ
jgi:hypothetical protein